MSLEDKTSATMLGVCLLVAAGLAGCGASERAGIKTAHADGKEKGAGPTDETSHCEFKGRLDREVSESVGTGSLQPSIRRVYRVIGEGQERRRVLVCREVDTNLDGVKDLVRRYSDQGEAQEEQADSDYDGELDTWIRFAKGRIAQVEVDRDGDGKADETRYYLRGKLSRIQRDSNGDGNPDIWEIYADGHLERMGVDVDFDGRVDRWNRDEVAARASAEQPAQAETAGDEAP